MSSFIEILTTLRRLSRDVQQPPIFLCKRGFDTPMPAKVTKAIFPVAGLGTRFLPVTKAIPKEMLPIVDKPLIQYAVEEAIEAGITELIFITSGTKSAIEDHFDTNKELEAALEAKGNKSLLSLVKNTVPPFVTCVYIRQNEQKGLGHALSCAEKAVGEAPCAVLLPDEFIINRHGPGCLKQLVDVYEKTHSHALAVQPVPNEETSYYGIVDFVNNNETTPGRIKAIVEKPAEGTAPSNYAAIGRYILLPTIFKALKMITPGAGGELQLSDAMAKLIESEVFYAHVFQGERYDCGNKWGYLQAIVQQAQHHPELRAKFNDYLQSLVQKASHGV